MRTRFDALIREVGVNDVRGEPHQRKYARAIAINWACNTGTEHCITESNTRLAQVFSAGNEFHQNVRGVLYCAALRNNTAASFNLVWQRLLATTDGADRIQLFAALGCTRDENSLVQYLNSSLTSTNSGNVQYNNNDHVRIFNAVYQGSQLGLEKAIQFLTANLAEARERYGALNIITGMASLVVNAERRAEVSYINYLTYGSVVSNGVKKFFFLVRNSG